MKNPSNHKPPHGADRPQMKVVERWVRCPICHGTRIATNAETQREEPCKLCPESPGRIFEALEVTYSRPTPAGPALVKPIGGVVTPQGGRE